MKKEVKAVLIDENGDANTVFVSDSVKIGDFGTFDLVDSSEVDYCEVYGEIVLLK